MRCRLAVLVALFLLPSPALLAQPGDKPDTSRGDTMLAEYFEHETARLRENCLAEIKALDDWNAKRGEYRRQLFEMLGLDPLPEKTDLKATITGTVEHDEFTVENLHFQSRPGLYVTGNLYLPKGLAKPAPAVLYVCGHSLVKKGNVSFGGKTHYQHHGGWFARNGYVCLTIDTLQLGEIEGIHHGTHRYNMWWWLNRGYTPAGVEAWNGIRALDYLQSRKEVDGERLGVTGRSGGGAYSWWIAALDDRIKAAVPVAGITDLQNHVVDGAVEGHCDCMFMTNTYRWDYPLVAALVAPRPLLISNTDRDNIFPLDGVYRSYSHVRRIYELHKAGPKIALNITAGGHLDTQELQVHAFRWFDQHLKGENKQVSKTADKLFTPEQLRVFEELPADQKNTAIHETFVPEAPSPALPRDLADWNQMRDAWRDALREKSFRGWPAQGAPLDLKEVFSASKDGVRLRAFDFTSQESIRLRLYLVHREGLDKPDLVVLNVLDAEGWNDFLASMRPAFETELKEESLPPADAPAFADTQAMFKSFKWGMAYVAPRGIGPTAWNASEKKQVQNQRRFMLLGQTLDGMRVWDVRRSVQALRSVEGFNETPTWLQGNRQMAGVALYAALTEPKIVRVDLHDLPKTHREGPFLLNVRRYLDLPEAVALTAEKTRVVIYQADETGWEYPAGVIEKLGWDKKQLQIRKPPPQK